MDRNMRKIQPLKNPILSLFFGEQPYLLSFVFVGALVGFGLADRLSYYHQWWVWLLLLVWLYSATVVVPRAADMWFPIHRGPYATFVWRTIVYGYLSLSSVLLFILDSWIRGDLWK